MPDNPEQETRKRARPSSTERLSTARRFDPNATDFPGVAVQRQASDEGPPVPFPIGGNG